MTITWQDRIVSTPDVLRGKPRIKGTRIPASLVLGYLAAGMDLPSIQVDFPEITSDDIAACLAYARDLADFETAA